MALGTRVKDKHVQAKVGIMSPFLEGQGDVVGRFTV